MHEQGDESFDYTIEFNRFRINQYSEGGEKVQTMVVNPQDTLYFESENTTMEAPHMYSTGADYGVMDFDALKEEISLDVGRDVYREVP